MSNRKGSVLVVEDNDLERQTLMTLLRLEGYETYAAADGAAALQYVDHDIDVVLSDLRMYGQSGVDLLRLWKARRPSTPFIFVTGVFEIAQVVEAVKLGAEDYITKPFNSSELLNRVAECIAAGDDDSSYDNAISDSSPLEDLGSDYGAYFNLPTTATMEEIERAAIQSSLRRHNGNRTHAAEALGISVRTLQRKLKAWAAAGSDSQARSIAATNS
jgi:DNA-binding NtrC family response regulator